MAVEVPEHVFLSPEPEIAIENIFDRPFDNAVATARTCYSGRGIVSTTQAAGEDVEDAGLRARRQSLRDGIARSTYKAGHHTTLQHAYVQFRLANVSRQFLWTFLHSHPFYNSEQVSQRYVSVKPGSVLVPPLSGEALTVYEKTIRMQMDAYRRLSTDLTPVVSEAYFGIFPSRQGNDKYAGDVKKKAQEVARYVLPIGTFAYLYHTVSVVTLLRYYRLCTQYDAPLEQQHIVGKMVQCLLERDPQFAKIIEAPLDVEDTPEHELLSLAGPEHRRRFAEEFDRALGGRISLLVDWKARGEEILAESVREVFGLTRARLSDEDAIQRVLDPSRNRLLGNSLNLSTHSKLMRTLVHVGYTFRKKLSHAADSQDQRHRMIPGSRPSLQAHLDDTPDYIEPGLIRVREETRRYYAEVMERVWEGVARLRQLGVPREFCLYLLPNAVAIRFTESCDLQNLKHKMAMRLCYNAQEEIWQSSLEEAKQIREIHPAIGRSLLPPCSRRFLAGERPICPEGPRYCGVPVWRLDLEEYERRL